MTGIRSYCHIFNGKVFRDGQIIFESTASRENLADELYAWAKIDYPKFHKMDWLSKFGFLASELLLNGMDIQNPDRMSIILSNASASLDTDINYWETAKSNPSPSLFVYTLPNIVIGEISIRNKWKGESFFLVHPTFDPNLLTSSTEMMFTSGSSEECLAGWVEVLNGHVDVFLYLVGKSSDLVLIPHTSTAIQALYTHGTVDA